MRGARRYTGDTHNFGRRVTVGAKRVHKPRTLLWEWLVLSPASPLRRLLARAPSTLGPDAFSFLPDLAFDPARASAIARSRKGGKVDRVSLQPLRIRSRGARRDLAQVVGRSLALFSWLGVSDLHWENLALGADRRGRIVFAPLDVEMILADLSLPTETKLLPDADPDYAEICRHAAGVRRVLPYLGKPIAIDDLLAIMQAYVATLSFLDDRAPAIADLLQALPGLRDAPIRVCLRGTDEYVRARTQPIWPPLLEAEADQLARGDIPYFFRLYGRPGIHYYAEPTLHHLRRLPLEGDVPKLDPILLLSLGLRSPSRKRLREEGLLTIVGAFDHPSFSGSYHSSEGVGVRFGARTLVVNLPTGEELHARRDLSGFVGSVYLPCRCGEVRSVFVPPTTTCRSAS